MALIFGSSMTRSLGVAAELGIADLLADGPVEPPELASECGVLESPLYRMLRAFGGELWPLEVGFGPGIAVGKAANAAEVVGLVRSALTVRQANGATSN